MKKFVCVLIVAVALLTATCQREGRVTGVRLDRNEVTINIGENQDLTATVMPTDATEKTVYWTSNDPGRVSVSNGRITGIAATVEGSPVNIRVSTKEGEFEDWCSVTVLYERLSFNDIARSTYSATGIPYPNTPSAPSSWRGEVYPRNDDGLFYEITNWANFEEPLWLDYVNGTLVLDDRNDVGEDGDYDLYFGAGYYTGRNWEAVYDYTVSYNKTTRTLDFSGTYDGNQVYVGIWGKHYITGEWTVFVDTQVRGAKLVLSPASFSSQLSVRNGLPEIRRKSLPNTGSVNRTATRSQSVKAPSGTVKLR
jgi:hypothetical protein